MSTSNYAAIILYYKKGLSIFDTIDSLLAQSSPPTEVIFVDNASHDGVAEAVSRKYRNLRVILSPTNKGYSGGMNAGVEQISSNPDFILFLTHEVMMETDCVLLLIEAMDTNPLAVQAGPALMLLESKKTWSLGGTIKWSGAARHSLIASSSKIQVVKWLDGACHLVRSAALESVGGFDERFFLYWEDVNMSLELNKIGDIILVKSASASQGTSMEPIYWGTRNRILTWRKQGDSLKLAASYVELGLRLMLDAVRSGNPKFRVRAKSRFQGLKSAYLMRNL